MTVNKAEIAATIDEINATQRALAEKGIQGIDNDDRFDALEIIERIEQRILANMPADTAKEAASCVE